MINKNQQNHKIPLNILIVDDEQSILDFLSTGLKYRGHNCFATSNAQDGLSITEREKIHFSLLDIHLSDKSGLDLCSDIRKVSPGTINVLMTGYPDIKTAIEGMKHSTYDYLVKPFRIDQVLAIIDRAKRDMRLAGEKRYIVEVIRNLKEENKQLRQVIHELTPGNVRLNNQELNKYKTSKIGLDQVAQTYSKHKDISRLPQEKNE